MKVLITGANGYIGRQLVRALGGNETLIAVDVRPPDERIPGVEYITLDVCAPELAQLMHGVDTVVHLAAIVTPGPGCTREMQHRVDVGGTKNVLAACVSGGVKKLIVTSSGAAYGYHADNAQPLTEDAPLRGNPEFAYSDHKRLVEELLAQARLDHPGLGQLVFRVGTVLGKSVKNQITALFDKPVLIGLREASSPFVFIWDEDLVGCLVAGVRGEQTGIYNVAGDGVMTLREIARALKKPFIGVPAGLLERGLGFLQRKGVTQYGPEQVCFLRYRPVLSNTRLKEEFGYRPRRTTRQAFDAFRN